ncbi:hypothetical protein CTAYLR_005258 [Chrysophaeum taylorii]|uniref:Phospho-2-dehydro-3-deoxyheptonate aldolase n=1 Tax=Chrysophaeum taylorii TaxID=2483200 RepID=A0AAD7ULI8_9STRA|nr:hypothetical protein CTAYLR_005258 [Chrysophaeum taylorii]
MHESLSSGDSSRAHGPSWDKRARTFSNGGPIIVTIPKNGHTTKNGHAPEPKRAAPEAPVLLPVHKYDHLTEDLALHVAARMGDIKKLRELLQKGISVETANKHGWRPLHGAAASGRIECLRALIAAHAQLNAPDVYGWRPLHDACARGDIDCARALIQAGADRNPEDLAGLTPLDIARANKQDDIAHLIAGEAKPPAAKPAAAKPAAKKSSTQRKRSAPHHQTTTSAATAAAPKSRSRKRPASPSAAPPMPVGTELAAQIPNGGAPPTAPHPQPLQQAVAPAPILAARVVTQWSPSSWRQCEIHQAVEYPDQSELEKVERELSGCAPLVFAGEVRTLQEKLAKATLGDGFVLMGGDCAESFDEFCVNNVRDTFRVILQMALTMTYGGGLPIIKIGRMAGQFAKPRSSTIETREGLDLPAYRGDNVNSEPFTSEARTPDPRRMLQAYHQCAQTLNILRAFSVGGYADISRLHAWNLDFMEHTKEGSMYRSLAWKIDESLRFMRAIGIDTTTSELTQTAFYTAHECLLLPYEQALTRQDSTTGRWYDCSAHMLWVGERTRQPGCAHFEFVRGISNPLGVKISDKATPEDVLHILETLNPQNTPGRITLITRFGADKIREKLPPLVKAVRDSGRACLWLSDPVHGNTFKTDSGFKTRDYDKIKDELMGFFDVHKALGTHPGGVHLEMTGQDVTECVGGDVGQVKYEDLNQRYITHCDPRLNGRQALALAFDIAESMRERQGLPRMTNGKLNGGKPPVGL